MITCDKKYLEMRCSERGHDIESVMPCVVSRDGDLWTIDTEHPAYPWRQKNLTVEEPVDGAGTELKKLLSLVGIQASENCSCNQRARAMNERGIEWCEENKETIVGWLREEAGKRGLPFVNAIGYMLVNRAIKRAKKGNSK